MKSIYQTCIPRQALLDGTADFVINLLDLPKINEAEAREFLDERVETLTAYRKSLIHEYITGKRQIAEADVAKAEAHAPEEWRKNSK